MPNVSSNTHSLFLSFFARFIKIDIPATHVLAIIAREVWRRHVAVLFEYCLYGVYKGLYRMVINVIGGGSVDGAEREEQMTRAFFDTVCLVGSR